MNVASFDSLSYELKDKLSDPWALNNQWERMSDTYQAIAVMDNFMWQVD